MVIQNLVWAKNNREAKRKNDRAASQRYRKKNLEKVRESFQNWKKANPGHARKRRKRDPQFQMAHTLRNRLWHALKAGGAKKAASTLALLGCPLWHLKAHFEFLFRPGMTWETYGRVWHVDHIKPVSKFDLTDPEQQKACFHWTNLQPLFAEENQQKSNKT